MIEAEVIRLRLEQTHESLREAETFKNNGLFRRTLVQTLGAGQYLKVLY